MRHFDEVTEAQYGRLPAHVLLLHANALAADHAGTLLDALLDSGLTIVPLTEALGDPLFALEDAYAGPKGLSWFYRTGPDAFERWGAWDDARAESIRAQFLGGQR